MSDNAENLLPQLISADRLKEIDSWVDKYPPEQKQSAVLSALRIVQEEHEGYLTEPLMDAVAAYLDMPPIAVYEVATFYSMYAHKPVGRHVVNVCESISCHLCGSSDVLAHLRQKLGINIGETTADGRFTLSTVECLGACVNAPMMQVDKTYHEKLTPGKIDDILEQYA